MLHQTYTSPFLLRNRPLGAPWRMPRLLPKPRPKPYLIDPLAFTTALIGAPLLVALLGCWALMVPVVAVAFGGPFYLLLGTPVLLWFIPRYGVNCWGIALVSVLTCVIALGLIGAYGVQFGLRDITGPIGLYAMFGPIFAGLWGLAFGWIYSTRERQLYKTLNARKGA